MRWLENAYSDRARAWVGFNESMSHRITAAVDLLLMPSRFEPCGLNQARQSCCPLAMPAATPRMPHGNVWLEPCANNLLATTANPTPMSNHKGCVHPHEFTSFQGQGCARFEAAQEDRLQLWLNSSRSPLLAALCDAVWQRAGGACDGRPEGHRAQLRPLSGAVSDPINVAFHLEARADLPTE